MRLRPVFDENDTSYLSTDARLGHEVPGSRFFVVRDASRWNKVGLVISALQVLWVLLRVRPHAVVTTGAAPGFFAVVLGRVFGSRTAWIDSIANAEELSLSGRKAGPRAHMWLTQWEHLAREGGPEYRGAVL